MRIGSKKNRLADNRAREPDIARRTHRHIGGALDWYPSCNNVHRADFLKLLADAQMEGALHFNHRLSAARETNGRVELTFSSGVTVEADLVIGADGIHSVLQREIGLKPIHRAKGIMAYRGSIPTERLSWAKNIGGGMSRRDRERPQLSVLSSVGRPIDDMVAFVPTNLESEEWWMLQAT